MNIVNVNINFLYDLKTVLSYFYFHIKKRVSSSVYGTEYKCLYSGSNFVRKLFTDLALHGGRAH